MNCARIKVAGILLLVGLLVGVSSGAETILQERFESPPDSAKPRVYWMWMNGNITKEGITLDLEAMKRVGVGGALIMNVSHSIPAGRVEFMTDEWRAMFSHAVREANRLGIELSMNNDDGWTGSGGPWNTAEHSMQILTSSEARLAGPAKISQKLPMPPVTRSSSDLGGATAGAPAELAPYYRDIAVLAFKAPADDHATMRECAPVVTGSDKGFDAEKVVDGDWQTGSTLPPPAPGKPQYIQFEFPEPFSAQSLLLRTLPGRQAHSGEVMISRDGTAYTSVAKFDIPSQHIFASMLGLSFPSSQARYWRIVFTKSDKGARPGQPLGLAEVELYQGARIPRWGQKAGYVRGSSLIETNWSEKAETAVRRDGIIDLTKLLAADGTLTWDAPAGNWIVLRIGHTTTGKSNHPSTKNGIGLECDKMSKEALEAHYGAFIKKIAGDAGALAGKSLIATHIDSWEVGPQNWTAKFREEFKARRGYDLLPYLPATLGHVVESADVSERFLWDYRRTCADLIADNYAGHLKTLANRQGLALSHEAYGCANLNYFQCAIRSDMPMSEFWFGRDVGICKHAASAAHAIGRKFTGAEAFTADANMSGWRDYPSALKAIGDTMFADGINRLVFHRWALQPWTNRLPGMTFGQNGIHFERTTTWFEQSTAWLTYLARCQYLLQEGSFAADYCLFVGEDAPEGVGRGKPSISPAGYDYDLINDEVLYTATVKEGRIVLPSGMTYRMLVLPGNVFMTPEFAQKIRELVQDGALVYGRKPERSPSLSGYPECDAEVSRIAAEVWGDCDGKTKPDHTFGAGKVFSGKGLADVFSGIGLAPDFEWKSAEGPAKVNWIHRRAGDADVYFVANATNVQVTVDAIFRVTGKVPEFWYPDTGRIETAGVWKTENGRTTVPIKFDPCGSVFVVFRKAGTPGFTALTGANSAKTAGAQIRMSSNAAELVASANGRYEMSSAAGTKSVEVTGVPEPLTVTGPWEVSFPPNLGAPPAAVFGKLISWPDHPDEGIKYFSGSATYTKEIDIPAGMMKNDLELSLDLGQVEVIAEVNVNGKAAGILWKPPFKTDITALVKPG
ncbi:MAG: glycosyl hydrolase, partial [Kiritimatiellales bacterium]